MWAPVDENRRRQPFPGSHGHHSHRGNTHQEPFRYPQPPPPAPSFHPRAWHTSGVAEAAPVAANPFEYQPVFQSQPAPFEGVSPIQGGIADPGAFASRHERGGTYSGMKTHVGNSRFDPSHASMIGEKKKRKKYWKKGGRRNNTLISADPEAGVAAGRNHNSGSAEAAVKDFRRPKKSEEKRLSEVGDTDLNFSQRCTIEARFRDGRGRSDGVQGVAFQPLDYGNSHAGTSYLGQRAPSGWERETVEEERSSQHWWEGSVHQDHLPLHAIPKADAQTSRTELNAWGQRIAVTVTKEASVVQEWIGGPSGKLFGFDLEWRPNFQKGSNNKVALLQVCGERECLIIQMLFLDKMPNALVQFLVDQEKILAGVNIRSDTKKLQEDHGLACEGVLELTTFAAQMLNREDLKHTGLKKLVKEVLGLRMPKPKRITMSNWAQCILDAAQVEYACIDAWASFAIASNLMARKS